MAATPPLIWEATKRCLSIAQQILREKPDEWGGFPSLPAMVVGKLRRPLAQLAPAPVLASRMRSKSEETNGSSLVTPESEVNQPKYTILTIQIGNPKESKMNI